VKSGGSARIASGFLENEVDAGDFFD